MENKDSIPFLRIEVILRRLSEERRFFFSRAMIYQICRQESLHIRI